MLWAVPGCLSDQGGGLHVIIPADVTPHDSSSGDGLRIAVWLLFDGFTDQFDTESRAALVDAVRVTSLRTGDAIATTSTSMDVTPQQLRIVFTPNAPLASGWYALDLTLPNDTELSPNAPMVARTSSTTRYRTRFHVGALPLLLASAEVDPSSEGVLSVGVGATERVVLADGASLAALVAITSGGSPAACVLDPTVHTDLASPFARFRCTDVDPTQPLTISVSPGVTSPSGVPLRDMTGAMGPAVVSWRPARSTDAPDVPSDAIFAEP